MPSSSRVPYPSSKRTSHDSTQRLPSRSHRPRSPSTFWFIPLGLSGAITGSTRFLEEKTRKNYLNRGLVFFAAGMWISIAIYTSLKSTRARFTQGSCRTKTAQEVLVLQGLVGAPSVVISVVAMISWIISIVLARKEIWPPGERYRPKFSTVW